MSERGIFMGEKERKRLKVISRVIARDITQEEAAKTLELSERQIGRIVKEVKANGDIGIMHKSLGRESNNKIPEFERDRILEIYQRKYNGFGPTFASEKLQERDGIKISVTTLWKWLTTKGLLKKRKKQRVHRKCRERKEHFGQMLQIDGSHHRWLGKDGRKFVLMGFIDDATSKIYGHFYEYEGTIPILDSFKKYVELNGLPHSVYVDRHSTYKAFSERSLSEFEKVMESLGIIVIHARSPQAKGRVERLFETLQDRLVKEMQLKGIRTMEEANEYLPEYIQKHNERFSVTAKKEKDFHTPVSAEMNLERLFCMKAEKRIMKDNTVYYDKTYYQIKSKITCSTVMVEKTLKGEIYMTKGGEDLRFERLLTKPERTRLIQKPRLAARRATVPSTDHPWKTGRLVLNPEDERTKTRIQNLMK
ncbi:MAG TPA: ISNCY family transposase [Candidatus Wallbacteria bacterium]|nr:ISNCY family transposase [Candidatus Wallbacteria bacterium]